jgi:cbb3-type cytochrome oxidase maturation protein
MAVIVLLIAAGGAVAIGFLVAFVWAVRSGQFDDVVSPAMRILFDDAPGGRSDSRDLGNSGERLHVRRDV